MRKSQVLEAIGPKSLLLIFVVPGEGPVGIVDHSDISHHLHP